MARYDRGPGPYAVDASCVDASRHVADLLTELGHHVEDVPPPAGEAFLDAFVPVLAGLAAAIPLPPGAEAQLEPFTRSLRALSGVSTPLPIAMTALVGHARQAVAATAAYDLVLSPTLGRPPARHGTLGHVDAMSCLHEMGAFSAFTALDNATGRPAINVPAVWSEAGLPIGVQLVAPWGREDRLLQVARQLEHLAPWADRDPRIFSRTLQAAIS